MRCTHETCGQGRRNCPESDASTRAVLRDLLMHCIWTTGAGSAIALVFMLAARWTA